MMTRTDSSMFCSYLESWMPPFLPAEKGNLKPTPRKLLMTCPMKRCLRGGDPHFDDPVAAGASHADPPSLLLDAQSIRVPAFGADEALRAARVHRLDDLVPERF